MDEEIATLTSYGIWELVIHLVGATIVTCRWVYTVKYKEDGIVNRYKATLVARDFT